jgi:hypothetical protein
MTRRVLKFNFPVDDRWYPQSHPPGSTPCHVACQYDARSVQVWVVEPTVGRELVPYEYRIFGTGHPVDDDSAEYVGTAVAAGGQLVWHVFRRPA